MMSGDTHSYTPSTPDNGQHNESNKQKETGNDTSERSDEVQDDQKKENEFKRKKRKVRPSERAQKARIRSNVRGKDAKRSDLPNIQTFEYDVKEKVRSKNTSLQDIQKAQRNRGKKETFQFEQKTFVRPFLVYASLVLIAGGILTLGFMSVMYFSGENQSSPSSPQDRSLIATQQEIAVVVGGLSRGEKIQKIRDARNEISRNGQDVVSLSLYSNSLSNSTLAVDDFMDIVGPSAPGFFVRSLDERYVYGVISNTKQPFIVLTTSSYEQALSGMLTWETWLPQDMGGVLYENTPTSTETRDIILNNRNARLFEDSSGETVLVYMFFDTGTIGIASNKESLNEIFSVYQQTKSTGSF